MSADNAIAILRTRSTRGVGHYEYRLAEYGVSGEPFDRTQATSVSEAKGQDTLAMKKLFGEGTTGAAEVDLDSRDYADAASTLEVMDGFVVISFQCAADFVAMFAKSQVFTNQVDALAKARRIERNHYVEYGSERVCIDAKWGDLLAQAEVVHKRRKTCKVRGPEATDERIGNWETRQDFKCLGGPGIEDKLRLKWEWPDDVVEAAMAKVHSMYFAWRTYRDADNLRFAREGVPAEMERYAAAKAKGCCQSHDEVIVVDSEFAGEVRVHFGFNFGH